MTQDSPQGTVLSIIIKAAGSMAKIKQKKFEADLQCDTKAERDVERRWTLQCSWEENGLVSIRFYICSK